MIHYLVCLLKMKAIPKQ